jgi:hypothetical protein
MRFIFQSVCALLSFRLEYACAICVMFVEFLLDSLMILIITCGVDIFTVHIEQEPHFCQSFLKFYENLYLDSNTI